MEEKSVIEEIAIVKSSLKAIAALLETDMISKDKAGETIRSLIKRL